MKLYFNWLGEWIEINNNDDYIMDMNPIDFINYNIPKDFSKEDFNDGSTVIFPQFITIRKENSQYNVHISQIVWKEDIKIFPNEEKW